jgi:hypothetical protein
MINNKNKHHEGFIKKQTEVLIFNADEDVAQPFLHQGKANKLQN